MGSQKIKFIPLTPEAQLFQEQPVPAAIKVPQWFKDIPPTVNRKPFTVFDKQQNFTIKSCPPITDAFSTGYTFLLHTDLQVRIGADGYSYFYWMSEDIAMSGHATELVDKFAVPEGYVDRLYKFHGRWGVETPKGFSTLVTHPFNRYDLPFLTVTGVVETDGYPFFDVGFFIKKGFEGVLEAGTPIAQILPFHRDSWRSETLPYAPENMDIWYKHQKKLKDFYKKNFWRKKTYQ